MRLILFFLVISAAMVSRAQLTEAPPNPPPDTRFKSDILLVLAHPDDETAIGSFLAKTVYDDKRQVAAVYLNRGNGGGNSIGNEQSMAMANIREIEVRRALNKFGIDKVWILDGLDTPGQDLFKSLQHAHHGAALEKIIRLIRLTRPEVIITWMPAFVAGENHGDHQAAGVLATEAFDLAGDPLVFPTQVTVPRDRLDIDNFQEGLHPWQPKKIYYFSDRDERLEGPGPAFDLTAISPSKKIPYFQMAAELHTPHMVQGEVSQAALKAMQSGDYTAFTAWLSKFNLIFGKSLVPCSAQGALFEGVERGKIAYSPAKGYQPEKTSGINLRTGGIFAFYAAFYRAHSLEHLNRLVKPEIMIPGGSYLHLPLMLENYTENRIDVELICEHPPDWTVYAGEARYDLAPGEIYPVQTMLHTSTGETQEAVPVTWILMQGNKEIGRFIISVHLREWTLPQ